MDKWIRPIYLSCRSFALEQFAIDSTDGQRTAFPEAWWSLINLLIQNTTAWGSHKKNVYACCKIQNSFQNPLLRVLHGQGISEEIQSNVLLVKPLPLPLQYALPTTQTHRFKTAPHCFSDQQIRPDIDKATDVHN